MLPMVYRVENPFTAFEVFHKVNTLKDQSQGNKAEEPKVKKISRKSKKKSVKTEPKTTKSIEEK